jgi:dTDP-4-amino-4,6-dideoxygalactose transaminase
MSCEIPLFKIYWDEEDIKAVTETISVGMYWAEGSSIKEFEVMLAEYVGTRYCVVFNSGTSALHACLIALGIGSGDEVIVPSFTFISTANAVIMVGAKPIFAEVEESTFGLNPESVEERISEKTRAVIAVHYGGKSCQIEQLKQICDSKGIVLIEDAAESLGATYKGEKVGRFGRAAMFSFCSNKVVSTGEGGAIVTDDEEIYVKLKLIRSHGRKENGDYFNSVKKMDYVCLGYNFRMPTMVAALGISQLKKVEKIINLRRDKALSYSKELDEMPEIMIQKERGNSRHVYQLYTIMLSEKKTSLRDGLQEALLKAGVATKVYFEPIHLTRYYREKYGYTEGHLPFTEQISKRVLSLPIYPTLKNQEIKYVCQRIKDYFAKF